MADTPKRKRGRPRLPDHLHKRRRSPFRGGWENPGFRAHMIEKQKAIGYRTYLH
jgi:hypothetical protein